MARKNKGNKARKSKATTTAAQPAAKGENVQKSAKAKATPPKKAPPKIKVPKWLHPFPVDYAVGTPDYLKLIEEHNERFGTAYNRWRVQPQVFYSIHEQMWNHYDPEQYKAHLRRGKV